MEILCPLITNYKARTNWCIFKWTFRLSFTHHYQSKKNIVTESKTPRKCMVTATNFAKQIGLRSMSKFIEPENQKP